MEERIAYLGMLQAIISRFSTTSLSIKGFSITLVTTIILLFKNHDYKIVFFLIALILLLSVFDAKYLKLEKEYRKLYDKVLSTNEINFSMKIDKENKVKFLDAYISWSVWVFYLILVVSTCVLLLLE